MPPLVTFILIVIFIPVIIFTGVKLYENLNKEKFFNVLVLILFGLELLRFFYQATFYEKATTPAVDMKLSYVTFLSVIGLFAAFNKSKIGSYAKKVFILTAMFPLFIGIFNSKVYTNELDVHSVLPAIYYVESGLAITLMIHYLIEEKQFSLFDNMICVVWAILYVGINVLYATLWETYTLFDLNWFLMVGLNFISIVAINLVSLLFLKTKRD